MRGSFCIKNGTAVFIWLVAISFSLGIICNYAMSPCRTVETIRVEHQEGVEIFYFNGHLHKPGTCWRFEVSR